MAQTILNAAAGMVMMLFCLKYAPKTPWRMFLGGTVAIVLVLIGAEIS